MAVKEVAMTTKERIEAGIEHLDEEQLAQLNDVVQQLSFSKLSGSPTSLMAKLKGVEIDGPEDFALNLDLYMSGEKRAR